jgi:hypothetical protein
MIKRELTKPNNNSKSRCILFLDKFGSPQDFRGRLDIRFTSEMHQRGPASGYRATRPRAVYSRGTINTTRPIRANRVLIMAVHFVSIKNQGRSFRRVSILEE